jgi:hypothetical protein
MSKASRLRLRNERRRKVWLVAMEPGPSGVHYLHTDGWGLYKGWKLMRFAKRRTAEKALAEEVLKDPSLIGRVWVTNRQSIFQVGAR